MRLTRGGWVLLGFGLTLGIIWAGASVWTLLEEQDNGEHLTRIERIVVGLHQARKAPGRGGDALQPANAGQQPSPGHHAGHQAPSPHHASPHPQGGGGDGTGPTQSETGNSAGPAGSPGQASEDVDSDGTDTATSPGLIGNPGGRLGETACAAGDVVKELSGVQVCSKAP